MFFRDCILEGVTAICGEDSTVIEQFETALLCASNLTNIHREMALRGLKAYLFGGIDRASEERVFGAFSPNVMTEMFESNEVDINTFQTIANIWEEFEFPTNGGRFASIAGCFILGDFPMDAISPSLMVFDKITQEDKSTPVSWEVYAESFLQRDQAGDEEAEKALKIRHVLADMINAVKVSKRG